MSNNNNRTALFPHPAQDFKQPLRLLRRQDCRWLVQNQDLGASI